MANPVATGTPSRGVRYCITATLFAIVLWGMLLPALRTEHFGFASGGPGTVGIIQDFSSILTFAKAFWRGEAGYDVESYLRAARQGFGRPIARALPFPYSPTMLFVLGPLCLLPTAWAYVVWTLLGVATASWMITSIWIGAAILSPVAAAGFALGQTAIFTSAALLFLISREAHRPQLGEESTWVEACVLWLLTAKPPVAVIAGIALIARRRWRPVAGALALTLVSTGFLTAWVGPGLIKGYFHLVTHYDTETADPAFAWSLVPATMGNLRALLNVTCGIPDAAASWVSSGVWLMALTGILIGAQRGRFSSEASWGFVVLAYLLFFPHVSYTEELHLVVLLALISQQQPPARDAARWATIFLVLVDLCCAPNIGLYDGPLRLPLVFVVKVLLALVLWQQCTRRRIADLPAMAGA